MILTLAIRNLSHDRVRFAATLLGILFSIVLIAVQLGLYLGARKMIVGAIDNANGQLWITAYGAKSFEEAQMLSGRERHAAMAVSGVAAVVPLVSTFVEWRKPDGGQSLAVLVGSDASDNGLAPWNVTAGSLEDLAMPGGIAVDRTYFDSLGVKGMGDAGQIESSRVRIRMVTDGIRSFTMSPYVFTTLNRARQILSLPADRATFFLVQLQPGADQDAVRRELIQRLPANTEVLTKAEFKDRSLDHWLYGTGAGVALIGGALLGLLVGTVIVAQTLYSSTKDHLPEFATLRAIGSSSAFIHKVILTQAGFSAVIGYTLGMALALAIVAFSEQTALPILMTPGLATVLFALTVFMCAISAVSAIVKVTKIDPVMVLNR